MTFLTGHMLSSAQAATGRQIPDENSVRGLDDLPQHIVDDVRAIFDQKGALCAFAYLYHVADASFADVKTYIGLRCWVPENQ